MRKAQPKTYGKKLNRIIVPTGWATTLSSSSSSASSSSSSSSYSSSSSSSSSLASESQKPIGRTCSSPSSTSCESNERTSSSKSQQAAGRIHSPPSSDNSVSSPTLSFTAKDSPLINMDAATKKKTTSTESESQNTIPNSKNANNTDKSNIIHVKINNTISETGSDTTVIENSELILNTVPKAAERYDDIKIDSDISLRNNDIDLLENAISLLNIKEDSKPDVDSIRDASIVSVLDESCIVRQDSIQSTEPPKVYLDPLSRLLKICNQTKPKTFTEIFSNYPITTKLGEATFSEVYSSGKSFAIKVLPFGTNPEEDHGIVNGTEQMTTHDVLQEVLVTGALSGWGSGCGSSHFVELKSVHIAYGPYPDFLLDVWDRYDEIKESENDRPDFFPESQLFAVIVLSNAGTDLEHLKLKSWLQARSILLQLILSIASSEAAPLYFEHRDLHWGNVMIRNAEENEIESRQIIDGVEFKIPLKGVWVTVIDYTLSRCEKDGELVYVEMDDEDYFTGEGDYQYEIYRMMRKETQGKWNEFHPKTNVMWIHYLIDKILNEKSLSKTSAHAKTLKSFQDRVLEYSSAQELVEKEFLNCEDTSFFHGSFEFLKLLNT